jgi:hypothetical protein
MKEKQTDFSCELPALIQRIEMLARTCVSYDDNLARNMDGDDNFIHCLGSSLQAIEMDLRDVNRGLYGDLQPPDQKNWARPVAGSCPIEGSEIQCSAKNTVQFS